MYAHVRVVGKRIVNTWYPGSPSRVLAVPKDQKRNIHVRYCTNLGYFVYRCDQESPRDVPRESWLSKAHAENIHLVYACMYVCTYCVLQLTINNMFLLSSLFLLSPQNFSAQIEPDVTRQALM